MSFDVPLCIFNSSTQVIIHQLQRTQQNVDDHLPSTFSIAFNDVQPRPISLSGYVSSSRSTSMIGFLLSIRFHFRIYGTYRPDLVHKNAIHEQTKRVLKFSHKVQAHVRGGGRKPWPQKGSGRARHGSIRSPLWRGGGLAHGPRFGTTHFYMLPFATRVMGLTSTLSAKFAQDDIKIVESFNMTSDESGYLEQLCEDRCWGPSILFVDDSDIMPRNITLAIDDLSHMNLMPVYGMNVHSLLKHETLILTVAAAQKIQERLLYHLNRKDYGQTSTKRFRQ
ncbi:unnamed protein product, partial [Meganyctiphanes norvegica]